MYPEENGLDLLLQGALSQVPDNLPPPLVSADIQRGKAGRCSSIWKNLQSVLEDSDAEDYLGDIE